MDTCERLLQWATAATIHDAKNLVGCFRSCQAALLQPRHGAEKKARIARSAEALLRTMEQWMEHGDYRRARKDNPLPIEEET